MISAVEEKKAKLQSRLAAMSIQLMLIPSRGRRTGRVGEELEKGEGEAESIDRDQAPTQLRTCLLRCRCCVNYPDVTLPLWTTMSAYMFVVNNLHGQCIL